MSRTSETIECRKYGTGEQDSLRSRLHTTYAMLSDRMKALHPEQCPRAHSQLEQIEMLAEELASLSNDLQKSMES